MKMMYVGHLLALTFLLVTLSGCDKPLSTDTPFSLATPTPTASKSPTPTKTPTPPPTATPTLTPLPIPTPTASPEKLTSCGRNIQVTDSSATADIIWERAILYLQELEICDAVATLEILDGENVGQEITGGGEPAGAYSWCYWDDRDVGTSTKTIVAVGFPDWDRWNTYLRGWVEVGEGMYPSAVLLHELYHIRQCLVTGEIVGDGKWTVDPDEYQADTYALDRLHELQAAPMIVYVD